MSVTIRGKRPKNLYEDWADSANFSWSIKNWEKEENKNKKKIKTSAIETITISDALDNQLTTVKDSVSVTVDRVTLLESRMSVVEEELNKKIKQKKIKITIRG